jgi:hypothetical protein
LELRWRGLEVVCGFYLGWKVLVWEILDKIERGKYLEIAYFSDVGK